MTGPQAYQRCRVTYVYNLERGPRGGAACCDRLAGHDGPHESAGGFGYGRIRWTEPVKAVAR